MATADATPPMFPAPTAPPTAMLAASAAEIVPSPSPLVWPHDGTERLLQDVPNVSKLEESSKEREGNPDAEQHDHQGRTPDEMRSPASIKSKNPIISPPKSMK
ncbi:MAG: hypothetical protein ACOX4E_07425 [Anaerovoracaceae bacterium]